MLKDGGVAFEGNADELRASDDAYIKAFLSSVVGQRDDG